MYRYGIVTFFEGGEKGARLKRTLTERMNMAGVITVGETLIREWYEEDCGDQFPATHKYVLHNRDEANIFKAIMESKEMSDPSIEWKIRHFENDPKLRKWIKGVEKRRREAEKNVKCDKV